MTEKLYKAINIPESCVLDKRVYKKLFHENADLGVTDRKTFAEDIDTVIWKYTLKPATLPVEAYIDDFKEYAEIALLEVSLKTLKRTGRIAEIVHRAIPYPVLVVFSYEEPEKEVSMVALSLAHKRFSQADSKAIVAEEIILSEWINLDDLSDLQKSFLDSLNLPAMMQANFFRLYSEYYERVTALNCSRLTGSYKVMNNAQKQVLRREQLVRCHEIENKIAEHRTAINKETAFSKQVELNTEIKKLETILQRESAEL